MSNCGGNVGSTEALLVQFFHEQGFFALNTSKGGARKDNRMINSETHELKEMSLYG